MRKVVVPLQPVETLPVVARNRQMILVVEADGTDFNAEAYVWRCGVWEGDEFRLYDEVRGDQRSRIVGWMWVVR